MEVIFDRCPDCGKSNYPKLERQYLTARGEDVCSTVRAICRDCGWRTSYLPNVRKCANEWNTTDMERE